MSNIAEQSVPATAASHAVIPTTGFTTIWGVTINPMAAAFGVAVLFLAYIVWQAHRSGRFDFWDILREAGKPSWTRVVGLCAFLVTTWILVDKEIKATLTIEWYLAYGAGWIAPILTKIIKGAGDPPQPGGAAP